MSAALKETLAEFEDQLRLQQENAALQKGQVGDDKATKTRVDDDGTVMEWNEKQRAWFPKIDDDFIANYQMNFGMVPLEENAKIASEHESAHVGWMSYASQVAQLKAERGESDPEVLAATAKLDEYYASPAYRVWYSEFQRRSVEAEQKKKEDVVEDLEQQSRMRPQIEIPLSADDALEKAAEEQRLGVPLTAESGKHQTDGDDPENKQSARKRKNKKGPPEWYEVDDDKNTHVYVSGLPPTITDIEFSELMSKCGIIMNDPISDKLRIKLYRDENGKPKGDGRCCYIKIESVNLALQIVDGMYYAPGYTLEVTRAKFQPKTDFDHTKHRRMTNKEKKKFKKTQEGLFKWKLEASKLVRGRKERVIILKDVFDEADLGLDVSLIPIIRERVRLQCVKVGLVKKIVVYDANPEGVVSVTFSTPEEADVAIQFLDKALFTYPAPDVEPKGIDDDDEDPMAKLPRTRQLSATRWDGKERFDKKETKEEMEERLDRWNQFLEEEGEEEGDQSDASDEEKDNKEEECESLEKEENIDVEDTPEEAVDTDEELEKKGGGDSGAETD